MALPSLCNFLPREALTTQPLNWGEGGWKGELAPLCFSARHLGIAFKIRFVLQKLTPFQSFGFVP